MKIVHCLIQYLPEYVAGTEVYTHTLAKMQQAAGHQVSVITPHIEQYNPGTMRAHYQYEGIDVYQFLETANPSNRDYYLGNKKPEGLSYFLELIKKLQPDVVHFHELNRSIGITIEHLKLARQVASKVFITMHLSFYTCNTNRLISFDNLCNGKINLQQCSACTYNSIYKFPASVANVLAGCSVLLSKAGITQKMKQGKLTTLLSMPTNIQRIQNDLTTLVENVDQVIALTDWYKNILQLNGVPAEKITVIPQALAHEKSKNDNLAPSNKNKPLKLVFLGRIQPQKGLHLIVEAFQNFSEKEICIDIYGSKEDSAYYNKCIEDSREMSHIKWKGVIEGKQVLQMLSTYDMLCLPSLFSEMSPLVIQEAFAAGIPVLASKVYGNMEQIRHEENGLLFDFNSVTDLILQLKKLLSNPDLLNQFSSKIKSPENFNWVYNRCMQLYQA